MIPPEKLRKKVFRLIQKKRWTQALALVEKERTSAKNLSMYYALYGMIHIYLENWQEANLFIQKSLQMNPFDIDALHAKAYSLIREAYFAQAKSIYQGILSQDRKNQKAQRNLKILNSSKSLEKKSYPHLFLNEPKTFQYLYFLPFLLILYFIYSEVIDLKLTKEKNRSPYSKSLYLTSEQIHQKKNILHSNVDMYSKKITLNELLVSNLTLEEKISLEHEYRHIFLQKNRALKFSLQQMKKMIDFPELFDGIRIQAEGRIEKGRIEKGKTEKGINQSSFISIHGEAFPVLSVPESWNSEQKGFFLFQVVIRKKKLAFKWISK